MHTRLSMVREHWLHTIYNSIRRAIAHSWCVCLSCCIDLRMVELANRGLASGYTVLLLLLNGLNCASSHCTYTNEYTTIMAWIWITYSYCNMMWSATFSIERHMNFPIIIMITLNWMYEYYIVHIFGHGIQNAMGMHIYTRILHIYSTSMISALFYTKSNRNELWMVLFRKHT